MKRTCAVICLMLTCFISYASDIKQVSATYEYVSDNPNLTSTQVEEIAFERARQKALEEKFGLDVNSVNSIFMRSRNEGETAQSETNVFSLGGISVRGQWIETTKEQIIEPVVFQDGFWRVKVKVSGKARNLMVAQTDIKFVFVRDAKDIETPVSFKDGEDLYLRFSTPVNGALCVYLVDEELNAYCLLPYADTKDGAQYVEANKDYVFFSKKHDNTAQEYILTCQRSSEQNALYVIYSPNTFSKANDTQARNNWRDEPMPRQLSYGAFLKWLSNNQVKDSQMVVKSEVVTIKK